MAALVAAVFWEMRHKNPIIDLRLFHDRSFAIGNMLMFMVGFALFGAPCCCRSSCRPAWATRRKQAGLALMPGGFAIMLAMPLVGFLLGRVRRAQAGGVRNYVLSFSLFHMTRFDLQIDFRTAATARVFQALGWRSFSCRSIRLRMLSCRQRKTMPLRD